MKKAINQDPKPKPKKKSEKDTTNEKQEETIPKLLFPLTDFIHLP